MSKLITALRAKYATPESALRQLGLDPNILEEVRLACDEDKARFRRLFVSLTNRIKNKYEAATSTATIRIAGR